jgi:hypothetical protein
MIFSVVYLKEKKITKNINAIINLLIELVYSYISDN